MAGFVAPAGGMMKRERSLGTSSADTAVSTRWGGWAVQKRVAPVKASLNGKARVEIEAPASNKRKISTQILIGEPVSVVWKVLTDYNRLADFIPNLAFSRRRFHPKGGIRLEQCGVQSILGFEFKASVVMDMHEINEDKPDREIKFNMVQSRDFKEFYGRWTVTQAKNGKGTILGYEVTIVPAGIVPVQMVEWRIREDIPSNLYHLKLRSESISREELARSKALSPGTSPKPGESPRC